MKLSHAIAFAAVLVLSACATSSVSPTSADAGQTSAPGNADMGTVSSSGVESRKLEEKLLELQKSSVYFDFDAFAIKPEYRDVIWQVAELMKSHGDVVVTLEGNADERGSGEYNLALGGLRAKAVAKALEATGVSGSRIRVVSLGSEYPRQNCHEESCWKENRRVDFKGKSGW